MHKFKEEWKSKFPRENWKVSENTSICSKHFHDADFVTKRTDTNNRRIRKKGKSLQKRYLNTNAVPTVFPNCPSYLTASEVYKRSTTTMSSNREQRLIEIELDSINSLSDVSEYLAKYKHKHEILCGKTKYIIEDDKVIIYDIETENEEQKLKLKYNFFINADLHYKLWLFDNPVSPIRFKHITGNTKISCFTEVLHLLEFLQNLPAEPLLPDEALYFVDKLKNIETPNNLVNSKLLFLIEQMHLTFMHNKHRRYSADLLSTCVLWENTSTNLYKQIREEGHLTIPSLRYIKKVAIYHDEGKIFFIIFDPTHIFKCRSMR